MSDHRGAGPSAWRVRGRAFAWGVGARPLLMGVLNVTPDSFSDGGRHRDVHEAVAAGHAMFEAGADIVDVGAESTRPGAVRVPARQQLDRAAPVIERLSAAGPVSVDTTLAEVAAGAIAAGACIVNDVSACTEDPGMAALAAGLEAGLVMMHRLVPPDRDRWSTERDPRRDAYGDVVAAVGDWLSARVEAAVACGVAREAIAVDPGFGFGKDVAQNLALLARIAEFRAMGLPVAAGVSRKSFIGAVTGCGDPVARDPASALAAAIAVAAGASIVRAHDVRSHRAAIDLAAAAARAG